MRCLYNNKLMIDNVNPYKGCQSGGCWNVAAQKKKNHKLC